MKTCTDFVSTAFTQEINNRITSQGYRLFRFQESFVKRIDHLIEKSIAFKWTSYQFTIFHRDGETERGKKSQCFSAITDWKQMQQKRQWTRWNGFFICQVNTCDDFDDEIVYRFWVTAVVIERYDIRKNLMNTKRWIIFTISPHSHMAFFRLWNRIRMIDKSVGTSHKQITNCLAQRVS